MVVLPDDLLLAGVVLHDVLTGGVGLSGGLRLDRGVSIAVGGIAAQPVTEDPVPDRLGALSVGTQALRIEFTDALRATRPPRARGVRVSRRASDLTELQQSADVRPLPAT